MMKFTLREANRLANKYLPGYHYTPKKKKKAKEKKAPYWRFMEEKLQGRGKQLEQQLKESMGK